MINSEAKILNLYENCGCFKERPTETSFWAESSRKFQEKSTKKTLILLNFSKISVENTFWVQTIKNTKNELKSN